VFVMSRDESSGQLCDRADEQRSFENVSSLQELVHDLCSVQRLSGCRQESRRRLCYEQEDVSLRHCSWFSDKEKPLPLPRGSLRVPQE